MKPIDAAWKLLKSYDNAGKVCRDCKKIMTEADNDSIPDVCNRCLFNREMNE